MGRKDGKKQDQGRKTPPKKRDGMTLQNVMDDLNARFILNCPEELASLERVFFQIEQAHWFYTDFYCSSYQYLPNLGMKEFSQAFVKRCPSLKEALGLPDDAAVAAALNSFTKYKHKVPVCGCALLNSDMSRVVLVKGWIPGSAWSFPKGKMNADEPALDCAIREVQEETNFNSKDYIRDPETDYIERTEKGQTLRLYIARDVPTDFNFVTTTRKEISDIQWFDVSRTSSGEPLSNSGQRIMADLIEWIEKSRPAQAIPAPTEIKPAAEAKSRTPKRSRNKKAQNHAESKTAGKRRGSDGDVVTFGNDSQGWSVQDMFRVNEDKFGIVNSFNMDEYTVPLPDAETQAKALAAYQKNQAAKNRGRGASVDKISPNLQPLQKQRKNTRRHSVGCLDAARSTQSSPEFVPAVAKMFELCANQQTHAVPQPVAVQQPVMAEAKSLKLPSFEASAGLPRTCGASFAPTISFAFNKEEILSCI